MTRLREALLTAGAVVGSLCLLVALAGLVAGVKPLVFRSGSMGPEIPAGSLGLARPVAAVELEVGDVVSVINREGVRVTHRVVTIGGTGGSRDLTLRGDANSGPDAETYSVADADRVFWSAPALGYGVAWLGSPLGLFVLGGVCVGVLVLGFRRSPSRPGDGGRRRAAATVAAPVVASVVLLQATSGTSAAFSDTAAVSTGSVGAYDVPKPAIQSCTVTGGALSQKTATIVWTEVSSPFAINYTATIVETGFNMTVTDNGSTRQTQFSAGLLSTVLNQTYNIRITAALPPPNGSWTDSSNQPVTITLLGLGMTCGTPS